MQTRYNVIWTDSEGAMRVYTMEREYDAQKTFQDLVKQYQYTKSIAAILVMYNGAIAASYNVEGFVNHCPVYWDVEFVKPQGIL